jgi:beta-mannanase
MNAGTDDQCIAAVANYLKQYPFRMMIRMMWEFDGNWFKWTPCGTYNGTTLAGSTPTAFISAWQRVVNIFKQQGATNVGFMWNPTGGYNRTCADASYPGDAYVDWVGTEGYNADRTNVWDTPLHGGWAEMNEILNYDKLGSSIPSYLTKFGPKKPFVIGESGSKYDTANVPSGHVVDPNRKANWFRNIATVAAPNSPYLHGIEFFDQWVDTEYNDWHVDHNQPGGTNVPEGSFDATTYQGFLDMSHAAVFNSGVAGGAN